MIRTQIQLEEKDLMALKRRARELGVSVAEVVRLGVASVLRSKESDERWDRAMRAVGSARSGRSDLAQEHDREAWDDDVR